MLTMTQTINYNYGEVIKVSDIFPNLKKGTVVITVIPNQEDIVDIYRNSISYEERRKNFHNKESFLNSFVDYRGKK